MKTPAHSYGRRLPTPVESKGAKPSLSVGILALAPVSNHA
eukprot:CAMPEP_0168471286 /NCGR_PEP_ID=MMETSP0228-20121227/59203_1 /TAXON_ID=133427 /ORGANISM="Protoceratium reticulatum, Strain CCCM 535 (=CCMP 1889)" /LENGTH=39 /DNA_ID= /DNA_START= /DNA_END= /DNA_ORIENTATION=